MGRYSFQPRSRIKKRVEFLSIQQAGKKLYSRDLLIILKPNGFAHCRLGVTVSKKVDKRAVKRNTIKRRIREIFRLNQFLINGCFDIVVIARKNAVQIEYSDLERQFLGALRHNGFITS